MPAKSKKQQRFFGMVHARQKGEKVGGPEVAKVAKEIDFDDADDFASTKHKGLPEKVKDKDKKKKDKEDKMEESKTLWQQYCERRKCMDDVVKVPPHIAQGQGYPVAPGAKGRKRPPHTLHPKKDDVIKNPPPHRGPESLVP
jgi:hypothetical protein